MWGKTICTPMYQYLCNSSTLSMWPNCPHWWLSIVSVRMDGASIVMGCHLCTLYWGSSVWVKPLDRTDMNLSNWTSLWQARVEESQTTFSRWVMTILIIFICFFSNWLLYLMYLVDLMYFSVGFLGKPLAICDSNCLIVGFIYFLIYFKAVSWFSYCVWYCFMPLNLYWNSGCR